MKKIFINNSIAIIFASVFFGVTGCLPVSSVSVGLQYSNPDWAPTYYPGVRYYYIPDIEAYYDLTNRDFVYLDNGQWLFSSTLPPMYSGYDLNNGYEIALNVRVFEPWMHHQFYVSNYPRYYYHNVYHNTDAGNIRGFNENVRKPFYQKPEERTRRTEVVKTTNPEIVPNVTRQPRQPNYYGKNIGRPVRVKPQMKEVKQTSPPRESPPKANQQKHENTEENKGHERR